MSGFVTLCSAVGLFALACAVASAQPQGELKPGDPAPAFTLPGPVHRWLNGGMQVAP